MLEIILTAIMKLHAAFRMRSCLRILTTALLFFQFMSWGMLSIHNQQTAHAVNYNGSVIHIELSDVTASDFSCIHSEDTDSHDDSCPAMEHALRTSTPVPALNHHSFDLFENNAISHEVIAKRLEIVYLSHIALDRAPKQSPPVA